MFKKIAGLLAVVLLATSFSWAQEDTTAVVSVNIDQILFGTGIENREAIGVDTVFTAEVGNVYCWVLATGAEGETQISFVWHHGDEQVAEVNVPVRSARWRCWTSKTIMPDATGNWKVEIKDEAGKVLESASFQVK
ncbi:MAG TPA: DUF2914 domain-containing protein [candidate division Zixibacteria bacterium]|nr:DUF2914 domain-containing protein [candidate division Zixibacteria bacterium]